MDTYTDFYRSSSAVETCRTHSSRHSEAFDRLQQEKTGNHILWQPISVAWTARRTCPPGLAGRQVIIFAPCSGTAEAQNHSAGIGRLTTVLIFWLVSYCTHSYSVHE
jgi:hypothetical protein